MGRRGPKRDAKAKRERSGRIDRKGVAERRIEGMDREEQDMLATGRDARERVLGVSPQNSRDQKAGSAIGRYCLQGQITQAQYDAAMLFLESHNRHLIAQGLPKPHAGAIDLNAVRGRPVGNENAKLHEKWEAEYQAARYAIQAKQNEIRLQGNLYGSLYAMLIRDVQLDTLLGDVRTACNALGRHYKLVERIAA